VLDKSKKIIEAGIDFSRQPCLFPTLITESKGRVSIDVLYPVPEQGETFECVMKWKEQMLAKREFVEYCCLVFLTGPERVALGLFPAGEWHSAHVSRAERTVNWNHEKRKG
jgi:hypothetical protein